MIRYYGSDGKSLLSSSKDDRTLRYSSVVRDSRSFELSQGSVTSKSNKLGMAARELRLSPVEGLSFTGIGAGQGGVGNASTIKREWDDVLTFHSGEDTARTWSVGNKRLGKHRFAVNDAKIETGPARAACVTACGNFGLVGYERADRALMWNMQSGIRRREFKLPKTVTASKDKRARHVSGIEVDALNTVVVLSTLAGALHVGPIAFPLSCLPTWSSNMPTAPCQFFDFHSGKHVSSTNLPSHIVSIVLQRENNLLACVCDDLSVRLVDIETKRTVREFVGFRGRIVDIVSVARGSSYTVLLFLADSPSERSTGLLERLALAAHDVHGLHHSHVRYTHRTAGRRVQDIQRSHVHDLLANGRLSRHEPRR
jgi:U3 small nucleolar RNA-associated protein 21